MKTIALFFAVLLLLSPSSTALAQDKSDLEAIHELIDRYAQTEDAGDLVAQAALMTADRVWIGQAGAGRRTDQAKNLERQQARFDATAALAPGIRWFTEARDRMVKFYGDGTVAVASFYWYRAFVLPGDLPLEVLDLFRTPTVPEVMTQVLVKEGGEWKIAHTHVSLLYPPAGQ
ncbi:MAG: nuclear transport factor 2 family protein [Gemmatimonadota bacterium]|nr:MAG: nuclear transport factor 2 family protein [Gemmatimonadota bacterium]